MADQRARARARTNGGRRDVYDISHSEQERLHDPEWDIAYRGDETISLCAKETARCLETECPVNT